MSERQTELDIHPRYDLNEQEIEQLESELAERLRDREDNLYALWIPPTSKYADIIRTGETKHWPEMSAIMETHEGESIFLAMFDTRGGMNKVVHGFRVSRSPANGFGADENHTGIVLIDDIIDSGQNLTAQEFREYYQSKGINLAQSPSVETNFRIQKTEKYNGLPLTQIGYIAIFQTLAEGGEEVEVDKAAVFASLNQVAVDSLSAVGLDFEPVVGRQDIKTPVADGEFDDDYTPVAIPANANNLKVFEGLVGFAAPVVQLK